MTCTTESLKRYTEDAAHIFLNVCEPNNHAKGTCQNSQEMRRDVCIATYSTGASYVKIG